MKYTRELIEDKFKRGERLKYIFFWKPAAAGAVGVTKCCLGQWEDCRFTVDGVEYHTAEQYMMAQKALLFKDEMIRAEIMAANHPKQYKDLGQKVSGFVQEIWDENRCDIVIRGNVAKFSQNEDLKAFLLNTGERVLVEASPFDKIWGIGMKENDPKAENPTLWNGMNLLGFCLMEVRDILRNDR
ncbi:MAG: NADAR family protein [Oscillospiraceae bacterium]|nr:NADAR family protein [Oscillospiraceae bacterium]